MNLIDLLLSQEPRQRYSYNGHEFSRLQCLLYDMFVEAMRDGRRLLIPSRSLPRACGKSLVIQKLSNEFNLYVFKSGSIVQYDAEGNERRLRGYSLRGLTNSRTVLIDEPTSFSQAHRAGAFYCSLIGYSSFEIEQSFRSLVDIATVELEVDELRKEGHYEHH